MSKPVMEIGIVSSEGYSQRVKAIFDTRSFYSILREDKMPRGSSYARLKTPQRFRAAARGSVLRAAGTVYLVIRIGERKVNDVALVSSELAQEMLIGAGTMQKWDISVVNRKGRTEVVVGRDMRDPDITEVD